MSTRAASEQPERRGSAGAAPVLVLAALYVVTVVVYTLLAHQSPLPLLLPDESVYGSLAQSLAAGDGLAIRGVPVDLNATLYVYLIAPAWKLASGSEAFDVAQAIGAALLCLTVFPVWLLARRYVGPWVALIPATLVVCGSWMLSAAGLLQENVALPLSAAALGATVVAVTRPGSHWGWAAIALALLAAFARVQLAVLIPIIAVAVAIDCARYWEDWRERLVAHRWLAGVSGGLTVLGLIAVAASPESTLGIYERFQGAPDAASFGKAAKDQLTGLLAMAAVLPVVIVAAGSARTEVWRDDRLGPLLAVTWAAAIALLAQSAWTLTTVLDDGLLAWHIQRYVVYALPLLLVAMTVLTAWRRVPMRELAIAGAAATLILLATPGVRDVQEERGLFGIQERVNSILGTSAGVSLALVSALLVGVALLAVSRLRNRPTAALSLISASVLLVFLMQAQVLWPWQKETTNNFRAGLPGNLSWIDDGGYGDVARMVVIDNPNRAEPTTFFNYDVDRAYTPPEDQYFGRRINGRQCHWTTNPAGVVDWGAACGAVPKRLLLDNDYAKVHFYDQKVLKSQPGIGRLVELQAAPPARPRLKAILRVPCGPPVPETRKGGHGEPLEPDPACFPQLSAAFWLDGRGELVLRYRGGTKLQRISFGGGARVDAIKPNTTTTLRLPVPQGAGNLDAQLDWQQAGPGFPELIGAELVESDGSRTDLLY